MARHALPPGAAAAAVLCVALVLGGCGSTPRGGADRDGPGTNPPPDLEKVPDALPQVEPIRSGGPNKPYEVDGQRYVPLTDDRPYRDRGLASWYGRKFHGRPTSSGEPYDMYAMTAAHPTWPIPSYARVRNPANAREVIVRINDRGPFVRGRVIDLSYTAALRLGLLRGVGIVEVERLSFDEIRTGSWRRSGAEPLARAAPRAPEPVAMAVAAAPAPAPTPPLVPGPTPAPIPVPAPILTLPAAPPPSGGMASADPPEPVGAAVAPPAPPVAAASPEPAARADAAAARGFWVQLGAFRDRDRAVALQREAGLAVAALAPLLTIIEERSLHRLQAGPYASRWEARDAADRVREALQLVPQVLERR